MSGAIQGTLCESLYNDLGLESIQNRQWYRKIILLNKISNGLTPIYLFDIIPVSNGRCYNIGAQSKSVVK